MASGGSESNRMPGAADGWPTGRRMQAAGGGLHLHFIGTGPDPLVYLAIILFVQGCQNSQDKRLDRLGKKWVPGKKNVSDEQTVRTAQGRRESRRRATGNCRPSPAGLSRLS